MRSNGFAGANPTVAVIEPEIKPLLSSFDDTVSTTSGSRYARLAGGMMTRGTYLSTSVPVLMTVLPDEPALLVCR